MNVFSGILGKLKDNLMAVVPITAIVLILSLTVVPLEGPLIGRFLIGSVLIVFGLSFFLVGVDIGVTPLGGHMGEALTKSNKLWIVLVAGVILGFVTSIAEPGLMVLANQVGAVTSGQIPGFTILVVVSVGLAIMLALGFLRVFYNIALRTVLIIVYGIIFVLALFTSPEFMGIAFDASGATTGILAVPFILSLAVGISAMKKGGDSSAEDSFGLVAIASSGAIIAVMLLNMLTSTVEYAADLPASQAQTFVQHLPRVLREGLISLSPLVAIFLALRKKVFGLTDKAFKRMLMGFIYSFIGLVLFFVGVDGGFMEVGAVIGSSLASMDNKAFVIVVAFFIGFVTMMAEPAVYVLTHQIEDITSGYVKRVAVLVPLCLGVGIAVTLSVLRTLVPGIQLWHYLLPGYIISIALTFFVPRLFVGIAFDAGGVATGPMTATFILAFTQGVAAETEGASLLIDGFGMISMVALFPIITLQVLGFILQVKSRKGRRSVNA